MFVATAVRATLAAQFHGPRYHHAQVCTTATLPVLFTRMHMHIAFISLDYAWYSECPL